MCRTTKEEIEAMKKMGIVLGACFMMAVCVAVQAKAESKENVYVADFVIGEQVLSQESSSRQEFLQELKPEIFKRIDEQRSTWRREDMVQLLSTSLVADL